MIIVGLTGGIGSGKTTVAKAFAKLGVPVYIADEEAKSLMRRSKVIKRKLIKLFGEDGGDKHCDLIITVTAPKETRIKRLLKRDNTSKEKIDAIMKNQWTDEEKVKHSDFVIENVNLENTKVKVAEIHKKILRKS